MISPRFHKAVLTFILVTAAGCERSPEQRFHHHIQTVKSWAATSNLAAESWWQAACPADFADHSLKVSNQHLMKEIQAAESDSEIDLIRRDALTRFANQSSQITALMIADIAARDRNALQSHLQDLRSVNRAFSDDALDASKPQ